VEYASTVATLRTKTRKYYFVGGERTRDIAESEHCGTLKHRCNASHKTRK